MLVTQAQSNRKGGSLSQFTLHPDLPFMLHNDLIGQRQTDTTSRRTNPRRIIRLIKSFEDMRLLAPGNAGASIRDTYLDYPFFTK